MCGSWKLDAVSFLESCREQNVPAVLERSRSGNGGHVWVFFSVPIQAGLARKLGAGLLTRTMERRHQLGLRSYDRLFPSQDTVPTGGFGNLIALPLQKVPRRAGNSVFVDERLDPRLDTLFLAMPISWHGTLQQYVGRLHRLFDSKKVVEVYDYVDSSIPMLSRMFEKRLRGYKALGYTIHEADIASASAGKKATPDDRAD